MTIPTLRRPRPPAVDLAALCASCDLQADHAERNHAELAADGRILRTWPRSTTHHRDCDCLDCRYP